MQVGTSKISFGFQAGIPLAGYVTRKERLADHSLGDLGVRAFALQKEQHGIVICCSDLLVMTHEINRKVHQNIKGKLPENTVLFLSCTHTHSSAGAYWEHKIARWFMGQYRPDIFDRIVATITDAICNAWADLEPGQIGIAKTRVYGMNESRRLKDDRVDDSLTVIRLDGQKKIKGALVRFSAHPVIASEKDFYALSPDYPGAVCGELEKEIPVAGFLQGALGGVAPVWPEHLNNAQKHIEFMAHPILQETKKLIESLESKGDADFACADILLHQPTPGADPYPASWRIAPIIYAPLVKLWDKLFANEYANRKIVLPGIRIGNHLLTGYPADLGNGLSEIIDFNARQMGYDGCVCCSQTNDYIGYVHSQRDMNALPAKGHRGMGLYENFMGFHGQMAGERFVLASRELFKKLGPARSFH